MTLQEIETQVLSTTDVNLLYNIQLELGKKVSSIHRLLHNTHEDEKKVSLRENLNWADNLFDICKKRQDDIRVENNKFNHKFRIAAKGVLNEMMYNKISDKAKQVA